ncbi:MAG: hypothetical protein [Caudoviricetes sp.]|nr:MAG: hypothetical protein [Caudoviricetes sp.]
MKDFFSFHNSSTMSEFSGWLDGRLVDRVKQLEKKDVQGNHLFGLFYKNQKAGLFKLHYDQMKIRQSVIETLKTHYPEISIHVSKLSEC